MSDEEALREYRKFFEVNPKGDTPTLLPSTPFTPVLQIQVQHQIKKEPDKKRGREKERERKGEPEDRLGVSPNRRKWGRRRKSKEPDARRATSEKPQEHNTDIEVLEQSAIPNPGIFISLLLAFLGSRGYFLLALEISDTNCDIGSEGEESPPEQPDNSKADWFVLLQKVKEKKIIDVTGILALLRVSISQNQTEVMAGVEVQARFPLGPRPHCEDSLTLRSS